MTPYALELRVYFEDTDAGGVMYHARYLGFAERARTEALRAAGVPHAEMAERFGLIYVVRRAEMEYLAPARLDDLVRVTAEPLEVGAARVVLRQGFAVGGRGIAALRLILACVRKADGRPARMPDRWRLALLAMMGASGSDG